MPENLTTALNDARSQTDHLFSILCPEGLYQRPVPERHRLIFYLGHLEAFIGTISLYGPWRSRVSCAEFDGLFEAGIDPDSSICRAADSADWPSPQQICSYNQQVRKRIDALLTRAPEDIVWMAIEHRLMHAETLAISWQNLPYEFKGPEFPRQCRSGETGQYSDGDPWRVGNSRSGSRRWIWLG